jgi:hypothetical protein
MSIRVPIIASPNQSLTINLAAQTCKISINQRGALVYLSLTVNNIDVLTNKLCRDRVMLVRDAYLPFVGHLAFIDTRGADDPDYGGFGTRYKLAYLP